MVDSLTLNKKDLESEPIKNDTETISDHVEKSNSCENTVKDSITTINSQTTLANEDKVTKVEVDDNQAALKSKDENIHLTDPHTYNKFHNDGSFLSLVRKLKLDRFQFLFFFNRFSPTAIQPILITQKYQKNQTYLRKPKELQGHPQNQHQGKDIKIPVNLLRSL
jgi:hypothetical protein